MANRAYLCCCDLERTGPSEDDAFDPDVQTVASSVWCVPLLWLALFAPQDLRDGDLAPLARRDAALERLGPAVARLEAAYPRIGPLGEHARLFREALTSAPGRFVTIELDEIAALSSRRTFRSQLVRALAYLDGGEVARPAHTLSALSGVDPDLPLVPPAALYARARPRKADLDALMSVLGASHVRPVPWEPPDDAPPKPAKAAKPNLNAQLHAALAAGDEAGARELLARGADPNSAQGATSAMSHVIWGRVSPPFAKTLVDCGFDLAKRRGGYTALQSAIWVDAADRVADLLALGASPTFPDGFRRPPLALAAYAGAVRCVDVLLGAGADPKAVAAAIRVAEQRLSSPTSIWTAGEADRVRAAVARLRAALA